MQADKISKTITEFCEKHYPKGNKDRGLVIVVLTLFLIWQYKKKE